MTVTGMMSLSKIQILYYENTKSVVISPFLACDLVYYWDIPVCLYLVLSTSQPASQLVSPATSTVLYSSAINVHTTGKMTLLSKWLKSQTNSYFFLSSFVIPVPFFIIISLSNLFLSLLYPISLSQSHPIYPFTCCLLLSIFLCEVLPSI